MKMKLSDVCAVLDLPLQGSPTISREGSCHNMSSHSSITPTPIYTRRYYAFQRNPLRVALVTDLYHSSAEGRLVLLQGQRDLFVYDYILLKDALFLFLMSNLKCALKGLGRGRDVKGERILHSPTRKPNSLSLPCILLIKKKNLHLNANLSFSWGLPQKLLLEAPGK